MGEYLGGSLLGLAALYLADMTYSLGVNNNIWKDDVSGRELLVCDIGYVIGNQLGFILSVISAIKRVRCRKL